MILAETVVAELRAQMGRQRVTQRELASRLGMSQANLSLLLRGNRRMRIEHIERMAEALDCELTITIRRRGAAA
jgi:transcriptional regulator with XRE-family HTH domain